jgi:hypothetical protein
MQDCARNERRVIMENNINMPSESAQPAPEVLKLVGDGNDAVRGVAAGILDDASISTIQRMPYLSFVTQVTNAFRSYGGGRMARREALAILNLWYVRGLDAMMLARLCCELLGFQVRELLDESGSPRRPTRD